MNEFFLKYDPDGGDMGLGEKVSLLEFVAAVPHIAKMMQALYDDKYHQYLRYGFTLYTGEGKLLYAAIADLKRILPKDVSFYEVDGMSTFIIRGPAGGVATGIAVYLYTK